MKYCHSFFPVMFPLFAALGILLGCAGCSSSVTGRISTEGRLDLRLNIALEAKTTALLRKLSSAGPDAVVLSARELSRSFAALEGITQVEMNQLAPAKVEGQLSIRAVSAFLAAHETDGFLSWRQTALGGSARLYLSLANGPALITALSPDLADYLSTLLAPLVTGEALSKEEYLELVSSVYGKDIAGEIAAARFKLSLSFPQEVRSVTGGRRAANTAIFDTPLLDMLVLEKPLVYEMSWGAP